MKKLFWLIFCFSITTIQAIRFTTQENDSQDHVTKTIVIQCHLNENEAIFGNSLRASVDHPDMHASDPIINIAQVNKYIPEFKQKKNVYDQDFTATIQVTCSHIKHQIEGTLYFGYLSTEQGAMLDFKTPVKFIPTEISDQQNQDHQSINPTKGQIDIHQTSSWAASIQNLVEKTKSPWVQILFAMLLGLLLSLTPCIYPMIPITIGILHSHGKKSLFHNFIGSLCYAFGIATTFACLGLLATTVAGNSFGSLLSNTPFVICLVTFIGYMSLTMIGIIDMYIPSFMQGEIKFYNNLGPFLAAYLFGAISGTVASPCVSPGLALLLSIVVTLGNKILGFLLLFAFGIGLSTPLIIIGTFSNSLYLLPKSGIWMVEIKKILGFFMLATCFYYLGNILPLAIVYWLFTAFTLFMALFYLIGQNNNSSNACRSLYNVMSIMMVSITIFMASKSYEKTFYHPSTQAINAIIDWRTDYDTALQEAQLENKLLLIDVWANHCTICKAIDKKVFQNLAFKNALEDKVIFLKIDATNSSDQMYQIVKEKYQVYAQPTILLIDPTDEKVIKKWSSEPYYMNIKEFIDQIINANK